MSTHVTILLLGLTFLYQNINAQTPTQNLRGTVYDAVQYQALEGASIALLQDTTLVKGTQTAADGAFIFENIQVGRYQIQVQYVGYEKLTLSEILLESGKEEMLEIALQEASNTLENVVVKASQNRPNHPVSLQTLTVEEVLRFPATYNDPARLAVTLPGVVGDNDQGNGIAIRGNSPNGLSWRLEGAEIVNPNHTPNAGTFSDRITLNGGGVNILSAQLMENASFFTGAFPTEYGNTLSGVMDVELREGNVNKNEFTAQIGLIGVEAAAEGPLKKPSPDKTPSSFLINYRYSTIGLLSAMGLDLGDEEIAFQDLAFKLYFGGKKGRRFSIFGMGGASKNIFTTPRDTALWETAKNQFDISFRSKMGALGMTYQQPIGTKSFWNNTLIYSATNSIRLGELLQEDFTKTSVEKDDWTQTKLAYHTVLTHKINANWKAKIGLDATLHQYDLQTTDSLSNVYFQGLANGLMIQPFVEMNYKIHPQLEATLGYHYNYFTFNQAQSSEPRVAIKYKVNQKHSISLAAGIYSQLQSPQLYVANSANEQLGFTKARHLVANYSWNNGRGSRFTTEGFLMDYYNVPVSINSTSSFSALNLLEGYTTDTLTNEGLGRNTGVELSFQKYFSHNFYYLMNATVYDAKFTGADGIERNARYNGRYIFNLTGGKEFTKNKEQKQRTWGFNTRIATNGGFHYTPINIEASTAAGRTIFEENNAFSEQYPAFFRVDVRVYLRRNKARYSSLLALDIQNVTNQENIAFQYYDVLQQQIITKNQLGLIPLLSYKVEF